MTTYVVFRWHAGDDLGATDQGGAVAGGGTVLLVLTLAAFGFDLGAMFKAAAEVHPRGNSIFGPGLIYKDPISVISLGLAFLFGTAGLPHVLMRFFTVPDAQQARRSIGYAVVFIGYFQAAVVLIGFGAVALLSGQTEYVDESGRIAGGANMVSVYLSRHVGAKRFLVLCLRWLSRRFLRS